MIDKNVSQLFIKSEKVWAKYNNKTGKVIKRSIKKFDNIRVQKTVIQAHGLLR